MYTKYTHFLILDSEKVFCCLQNLLGSSILSGIDVSFFFFCHLSPCFLLQNRCSFIIGSEVHFNTYAMFSLLRVFVYFYFQSLFLSPHLPGRNFYALQCCTQCERACCFRRSSPAASFTQDVFICSSFASTHWNCVIFSCLLFKFTS